MDKERNKICPFSEKGGHYWIIPEANGPKTVGTCKLCGAEKEFRATFRFVTMQELSSSRRQVEEEGKRKRGKNK